MFKVRVEAQETYRSSIRPAIFASIRQVMESLNANTNVLTFYSGESEISRMIGTNFSEKPRTDQPTDVGYHDRQFITVDTELAGVNDELDAKDKRIKNYPLWLDPITGSMIVPMFVTRKITIGVNRYFKDRVMANQFRDRVRNTLSNGFANAFSPIVHYPLSYQIMDCYETIYNRLVAAGVIDGSKISPFEWFKTNCKASWDVITDIAGKNPAFVFKRRIDTLSLLFDGVNITRSEKGRYNGQHLVNFEYSFYYPDHTFFELHYPIIVYQQMTDEKYIPGIPKLMLDDYPIDQFYEGKMATHSHQYMKNKMPFMFVFPKEDNFRIHGIDNLELVLQRLACMDDVENQTILNLFNFSELDSFWNENVERFIKKYHKFVTVRHKSPFNLKVFSDDIVVKESHISLDENGNVTLSHKPTMSAAYRVCFYLDLDIANYDSDAWDSIVYDCEFGQWVFSKIFPWMPIPTSRPCPTDPNVPWIDKPTEIDPYLPKYPDWRKIYMMEALLIAKNIDRPDKDKLTDFIVIKEV